MNDYWVVRFDRTTADIIEGTNPSSVLRSLSEAEAFAIVEGSSEPGYAAVIQASRRREAAPGISTQVRADAWTFYGGSKTRLWMYAPAHDFERVVAEAARRAIRHAAGY